VPVPSHEGPIILPADLAGGLALIFVE
jgi:hypothetical protein